MIIMMACSLIAILVTIGIVASLIFEAINFFQRIPFLDFVTGVKWSPQTALRVDQVAAEGAFGVIPLFTGTLLISAIAMLVATPLGLASAVYLAEYAERRTRDWIKPMLEILAGIPTVVYGFFAALTVAPFIRWTGGSMGLEVASESALAAGLVMGVMIIPLISSLSDDVINAVPQALRDASLGLNWQKSAEGGLRRCGGRSCDCTGGALAPTLKLRADARTAFSERRVAGSNGYHPRRRASRGSLC